MKRKLQIITIASAASFLAFTALAQEKPNAVKDAEASLQRFVHATRVERLGRAEKASDIIGMEVKNYQDEKVGKVNDLAVDLGTGRIVQVILSSGGFIGVGDTLVAVPPGALHRNAIDKVIHLNADKEKLKAAPKFEMSKWAEGWESNHVAKVYRYYGEEPYFAATDQTTPIPHSSTRLGYVQKASKVMDLSVKNLQDEQLGKVENLMVDLSAGRVVAVIVSSGGFLGIGDELSAIPPTALRLNSERDTLQLDISKEALSNAPHFKASQWPDIGQPSYAYGVYHAYRVEPYFSTNTVTAGNTARTVRDLSTKALTTLDQGNSTADRDRTAQIRKEIVAGKGMSVNARDVKIITIDGKVTLRGPVNSEEEKRLIGEIADRIAQPENVSNQLQAKLTPTGRN